MVFANNALEPNAEFKVPSYEFTAPTPLLNNALSPTATRLLRLLVLNKAPVPTPILEYPVVLKYKDVKPIPTLLLPVVLYRMASLPIALF